MVTLGSNERISESFNFNQHFGGDESSHSQHRIKHIGVRMFDMHTNRIPDGLSLVAFEIFLRHLCLF